jgi:hypothetical protein
VVDYLHSDSPLGVIDINKMTILLGDYLSFSKDFLVAELRVIPAFKVQCPTLHLRIVPVLEHGIDLIQHLEVLGFE